MISSIVKNITLIALPFALSNCVAPSYNDTYPAAYNFFLSPNVDAETQASVVEAANEWTDKTGVQIAIHNGPATCTGDWGCFQITMASEDTLAADAKSEGYPGHPIGIEYDSGSILILAAQPVLENQFIVLHEMGHAIGLKHPCEIGPDCKIYAVMNPVYEMGSLTVSCNDQKQYATLRKETLPSCSD